MKAFYKTILVKTHCSTAPCFHSSLTVLTSSDLVDRGLQMLKESLDLDPRGLLEYIFKLPFLLVGRNASDI